MSAPPDNPPGPLATGSVFHEHYRIVRCLRAGGMGAVYEVVHLPTERHRALKTILPEWVSDPEMRARFRMEATVTAGVESEHIVEVLDAGVDESTGLPFLVMELLKGESLAQLLERRGSLSGEEVVRLLGQAALGLERAHAAGIVHRDLKPENLFVTRRDDGSDKLVLLDFGIAKIVASHSQAATTRSLGTPLYMSPEHIRGDGDIGPGADVYSLGQLAYTLLVGQPYFLQESRQQSSVYGLLLKIMESEREPASARAARSDCELDSRFDAWFAQATAAEAWQRFAGCSELVSALAEALGLAGGTQAGLVAPPRRRAPFAVSPLVIWFAIACAALLAFDWFGRELWAPRAPEAASSGAAPANARPVNGSATASAAEPALALSAPSSVPAAGVTAAIPAAPTASAGPPQKPRSGKATSATSAAGAAPPPAPTLAHEPRPPDNPARL